MEHFPSILTREQSDAFVDRFEAAIDADGFGLWAAEIKGGAPFIGFVGLSKVRFHEHFTPAVEVGWRLAREHWGQGYAPEAARAAVEFGFSVLELPEIVSFTIPENLRSRRVMEKIGFVHDLAGDFEHPGVPQGHRMRRHVLYRRRREASDAPHLPPAAARREGT